MTSPRRHIPGQVAMLTRRCTERRYYLSPDDYINDVLAFEVGKGSTTHGVEIYAAMAMSNHVHFGVGDRLAKRSFFMQDAMSGIARARNRDLKRTGRFWELGSYGDTVLLDQDAVERKLLYIWLNPVVAGLVRKAKDWPGFTILPEDWGKKIRIERPGKFYGRKNPEVVEFEPKPPPGYEEMSLEEVKAYFEKKLAKEEAKIARKRRRQGIGIVGVKKIEEMEPTYAPELEWPPVKRINPRFATKDGELMGSAISTYKAFCDAYETCRQRWLKGKLKGRRFPCGTLAMKYRSPVKCAEPPDDEPGLFAVA